MRITVTGPPGTTVTAAELERPQTTRLGRVLWSRAWAGWPGIVLAATVVTLLNWPAWARIEVGLDTSWQAGLSIAFIHRLQWGPGLDFTYGPYGFAGFLEPFYRSTALVAFVFIFAVTWLLAGLLVAGLRHYWGLAAAGVVAWAVVELSWAPLRAADIASVVGLGLALCIFETGENVRRANLATLLGALAGFVILVKLNTGVVLVGLLVLALAGSEGSRAARLRAGGQAGAALVAMFVIGWAGAGQSFANLASFIRASVSLLVGYSAAMGDPLDQASTAYWAVAILLVAAGVFAPAFRGRSRWARFVLLVMLAGWSWAVVKEGFVAGNHFPGFFRIVLAAIAIACLLRPPRWLYGGGLALAACITLVVSPQPVVDPFGSVRAFGAEVADLAQSGRFARLSAQTRVQLLSAEMLPRSALSLLGRRTLAIEPWEDLVAWAVPAAKWDPEPVVQSYSAYTSYLDHLDASFLASPKAPERVLYWPLQSGFDSRDPFMDPPATTEAIYCHYIQEGLEGPWQLLGRVPDRCGPESALGQVRSRFGLPVDVPSAPGKMVVATFTLSSPLLSKLQGALLKPPEVYLTTWSGHGRPVRYRFVTGTAGDEHVLSAPSTLGYSSAFTPDPIRRLELSGGGWTGGEGSVTVVFREVTLLPERSARDASLGGHGARTGLGQQRAQLRRAEGVSGARAVGGDGESYPDHLAPGSHDGRA